MRTAARVALGITTLHPTSVAFTAPALTLNSQPPVTGTQLAGHLDSAAAADNAPVPAAVCRALTGPRLTCALP